MSLRIERLSSPVDVEVWTVERPDVANALDAATLDAMNEAIHRIEHEETPPRGIVLTGGARPPGKRSVFLSGADLREVASLEDAASAGAFAAGVVAMLDRLERSPALVVAAIEGDVYGGGCEVAIACDLRVMARGYRFEFRQTRMGFTTGWGATTRLVHALGIAASKRLLLTGAPCDADEALRLGLITELVEPGDAVARALECVRVASEGAPSAIAAMKRGIAETAGHLRADAYAQEIERFVHAWSGADHREAIDAMRMGRKPRWRS